MKSDGISWLLLNWKTTKVNLSKIYSSVYDSINGIALYEM